MEEWKMLHGEVSQIAEAPTRINGLTYFAYAFYLKAAMKFELSLLDVDIFCSSLPANLPIT
jgi:hypothetical protein